MNLNSIAFFNGNITIYWTGIVIALGILAGFFLTYSLYTTHNSDGASLFVFFPIAVILSVIFCRAIHWYTHIEQYKSFFNAMTDFSGGSYYLQGSLLGVFLASVIVYSLGIIEDRGELMDALAPGYALAIAVIRLSCLFNNLDRGKMAVSKKALQRLPIAAPITDASGAVTDWRFATFFIQFLLMICLSALLVKYFINRHNEKIKYPCPETGNIYKLFLIYFSAIELVCDSTRYDATHMHFSFLLKVLNKFFSFISLAQIIAAVTFLVIMIHYTKASSMANGKSPKRFLLWIVWVLGLGIVSACEYLVQRYSGLYLMLYSAQSVGCILMALSVRAMYSTCIEKDNYVKVKHYR